MVVNCPPIVSRIRAAGSEPRATPAAADAIFYNIPSMAESPAPQAATRSGATALRGWLRDLAISVGISAFIIMFLYQPVKVEGTSMLPGLQDQERIFVNKFLYNVEPIERGDIVVFHYPRDPSKSYIKRVIGVAGDTVQIKDGRVYLNGKLLDEPYVPAEYEDTRSYGPAVVPADSYFVLGDHRSLSSDSRDFGPVARRFIYGKAEFVYWPVGKLGRLH
jgi:signal peptidase I